MYCLTRNNQWWDCPFLVEFSCLVNCTQVSLQLCVHYLHQSVCTCIYASHALLHCSVKVALEEESSEARDNSSMLELLKFLFILFLGFKFDWPWPITVRSIIDIRPWDNNIYKHNGLRCATVRHGALLRMYCVQNHNTCSIIHSYTNSNVGNGQENCNRCISI